MLEKKLYDATGALAGRATQSYDADGRLASVSTPEGKIDYDYNANGELARLEAVGDHAVEYRYDTFGVARQNSIRSDSLLIRG